MRNKRKQNDDKTSLNLSDALDEDVLAKLKATKKALTQVEKEEEKERQKQLRLEREEREKINHLKNYLKSTEILARSINHFRTGLPQRKVNTNFQGNPVLFFYRDPHKSLETGQAI